MLKYFKPSSDLSRRFPFENTIQGKAVDFGIHLLSKAFAKCLLEIARNVK